MIISKRIRINTNFLFDLYILYLAENRKQNSTLLHGEIVFPPKYLSN